MRREKRKMTTCEFLLTKRLKKVSASHWFNILSIPFFFVSLWGSQGSSSTTNINFFNDVFVIVSSTPRLANPVGFTPLCPTTPKILSFHRYDPNSILRNHTLSCCFAKLNTNTKKSEISQNSSIGSNQHHESINTIKLPTLHRNPT